MDDFHCSYCGKRRRDVFHMISGPRVFICDECVALCASIVAKAQVAAPPGVPPAPEPPVEPSPPSALSCSFCNKAHREVANLIAGGAPGAVVHICNECVELCVEIVAKKRRADEAPT